MIHLACGSDDGYVPHAAVMLRSVIKTCQPLQIHVHYLCDDSLSFESRQALSAYLSTLNARITFIDVSPQRFEGLYADKRLPKICWYRTLLPELLPELDKILYLDTDIVALANVNELWQLELGNYLVAAANDYLAALAYPEVGPRIGVAYDAYFNSGVMLLNLRRIRETGGGDYILKIAQANRDRLYFPDQDALNLALGRDCIMLDPSWNYPPISPIFLEKDTDNPLLGQLQSCMVVRSPGFRPKLLHFLAHPKPWQGRPVQPYFWHYYSNRMQTPWAMSWSEFSLLWMKYQIPLPLIQAWRRFKRSLVAK